MEYSVRFSPTDVWLGVAWGKEPKTTRVEREPQRIAWDGSGAFDAGGKTSFRVDWFWHLYICLVPCFPIHLIWSAERD